MPTREGRQKTQLVPGYRKKKYNRFVRLAAMQGSENPNVRSGVD